MKMITKTQYMYVNIATEEILKVKVNANCMKKLAVE